jgi:hypothetical protein
MSKANPGDTVGWPQSVERWVVVDVDGDGIAVVRHESDRSGWRRLDRLVT